MANGYLGTSEILTSSANEEILPKTPSNWTDERYSFYKFSFINYDNCQIKVNNGKPIHLNAEQGFECERGDQKINSFIIVDGNVRFSWIGAY